MQNDTTTPSFIAFAGLRRIASGEPAQVALAVKRTFETDPWASVLVFDDVTSERIELDLRGSDADVLQRLESERESLRATEVPVASQTDSTTNTGPGRPKLGVVAREVTLLPRHWDWLGAQPGGASVALRKLVEEARRAAAEKDRVRESQESCYRFLSAIAGNLPNFEEVNRALFAGNGERFGELTAAWSPDVREHAQKLAAVAFAQGEK